MSRVIPILFNGEMVRAILDGRKTVTRRVLKLPNYCPHCMIIHMDFEYDKPAKNLYCTRCGEPLYKGEMSSHCQPGGILYVREAWNVLPYSGAYMYRADCDLTDKFLSSLKWRPSIHMPKEAARIWLKVTDVRVERLQYITDEQAQKEGCTGEFIGTGEIMGSGWNVTPVDQFSKLWDSTVKKADLDRYGWEANPWVWVIEFERCDRPKGGNV